MCVPLMTVWIKVSDAVVSTRLLTLFFCLFGGLLFPARFSNHFLLTQRTELVTNFLQIKSQNFVFVAAPERAAVTISGGSNKASAIITAGKKQQHNNTNGNRQHSELVVEGRLLVDHE